MLVRSYLKAGCPIFLNLYCEAYACTPQERNRDMAICRTHTCQNLRRQKLLLTLAGYISKEQRIFQVCLFIDQRIRLRSLPWQSSCLLHVS